MFDLLLKTDVNDQRRCLEAVHHCDRGKKLSLVAKLRERSKEGLSRPGGALLLCQVLSQTRWTPMGLMRCVIVVR